MMPISLEASLQNARVLVCAGTGGVGKTTIAAALAIQAALSGRRTLVLTIDPAKRLADALGLEFLGAEPMAVDLSKIEVQDGNSKTPALAAMMLDTKPTFDRLIARLTKNDQERQRIFDNRIYQQLSSALAGSHEYAAMEQVHELIHSNRYDLIVVDTPPADHALDFLRAPRRLRDFLESRFVATLVRPAMSASRIGMRVFGRPLQRMFGLLERIAGVGFLDDLTEFLRAIDGLSTGFRERATRVEEVLLGEETGFVLISSASSGHQASTLEFMAELDRFQVPLVALVVNRLRPWPPNTLPNELRERCHEAALLRDEVRLREALHHGSSQPADSDSFDTEIATLTAAIAEYTRICEGEQESVDKLTAIAARRQLQCHRVPELDGDIAQLDGLLKIGATLRAKPGELARSHAR
jgi:anion-transporting  ArsA/GET3 family ATPase